MFSRYCLLGFLLLACSLISASDAKAQEKDELRVLFIGNSFTYGNDLPAIVEALAEASKQKGQKRFIYKAVVFPSLSLKGQWDKGDAQKVIASDKWDIVVLQQGPSALEESRQMLLEYVRLFDKEIRASGAKPALYMVWPSEARFNDFDRVVESYKLAADEVKGIIFPVGQAWREAWKSDAKLALYAKDRFHPSVTGSYLAALVIYEKLFGKSSVGLPASLKLRSKTIDKIELPEEQAKLLQAAATEANKKF
jgi:hypothetical protein